MAKNLTKEEQTQKGLEVLLLGREWYLKGRTKNQLDEINKVRDLYFRFDEIHKMDLDPEAWQRDLLEFEKGVEYEYEEKYGYKEEIKEEEELEKKTKKETTYQEKIRKRLQNYLDEVKTQFGVTINFQSKQCSLKESDLPTIFSISSSILKSYAHLTSDDALQLVLRNWKDKIAFPTFLIVVRYAIKFKLPIVFQYNKVMWFRQEPRRVYPRAITLMDGKLGLISYDTKDKQTKSFILSRIQNPELDFYPELSSYLNNEMELPNFDLIDYLNNNPNAKFQKKEVIYTIWMTKNNLDYFLHSINLPCKVIKEDKNTNSAIVEIKTYNEYLIFDMLFNYQRYAKLIGPKEAVSAFRDKLHDLTQFYSETIPKQTTKKDSPTKGSQKGKRK
ncbi:WYL domain-containing protein [Leptospira levettii]|uniref:WYL domain-containing protein n=1 Tax=Leptospira levettii TaxID=2023178 RepID=A0AAW5V997_9LEPT|nr:WYL domain-containing protein [Leptospira levettii]MCW7467647.1 WYL domain-containing protein [Leptospira levettii]MCW7513327.1 WYL domain-containing protein [Leptospira levettii]MCW7517050.1 WYL domain-containing protein [Leptospira levettii]